MDRTESAFGREVALTHFGISLTTVRSASGMDQNPLISSPVPGASPGWLGDGGEMGALIRSIDWGPTPLGPVDRWPQSLRTALSICLSSRFPILIWWGPQFLKLYNDAYRQLLGDKHPKSMGQPGRECWAEIWHIIGPMLEGVLHGGEATWSDDQMLPLRRHGFTEECYFTFTYSPIRVEHGGIGGVFCAVVETTDRVLATRRLATLRDLAATAASAADDAAFCAASVEQLHANAFDAPFALLYLLNDRDDLTLSAAAGLPALAAPASIRAREGARSSQDLEAAVLRVAGGEAAAFIERLPAALELSGSPWPEQPSTAVALPIANPGQDRPYGVLVAGVSPRRPLDETYRSFLTLAAVQIAHGIANARAHIEERRRAQALAEIDRAKTAFFSNVSHEFRTPLTLMLGPLDELIQRETPGTPARETLEMIYRNGLRLQRLVNTLLDFSRIEAGRVDAVFEPTDLAALTADLASNFRSACEHAGLVLRIDCPPLARPAYVDRDLWEKIVLNLLSNAFKFTFAGGIHVSIRESPDEIELMVRDTGIGIPAHELPHIFERFHRVKDARARTHEGTGIGLSLVHELVKIHGGRIHVQSTPAEGSAFTVTIPAGRAHLPPERIGAGRQLAPTAISVGAFVEEASRALRQEHSLPAPGARRARVLWADDNADMRQYVRRLLSGMYDVEEAADGRAAFDAALARVPDLVVTDVMMPGLDGFELLRRLRERPETSRIPVVLVSARAGDEARLEGLAAGADDYIVKPFTARELLARVAARLEVARLRDEWDRRVLASEERLRLALGAGRFGSWQFDVSTGQLEASDQCKAHFGLGPSDRFSIELFRGAVHPDDRPRVDAAVDMAIAAAGDYETEYRCVWPDGSVHWINARGRAVAGDDGGVRRIIGVTLDVTERKHAEEQIASDLQTMTLLQRVGDICSRPGSHLTACLDEVLAAAIRITDAERGNIQIMDSTTNTLRIAVQRGFSAPFLEFFQSVDARSPSASGAALAAAERVVVGDVRESQVFAGQPSQKVLLDAGVVAVQSTPLVASDGRVLGMLSTHYGQRHTPAGRVLRSLDLLARQAADYLERTRAEQALREADRRKDEFLATLAHELRNPLAPVRTGIQLLRMRGTDADGRRITDMMERQVDHMVRLVDDLLEASRITSGKIQLRKEVVELRAVVRNAIETVQAAIDGAGHHLRVTVPDEPVWLEGDPVRLAQILSNLLSNAIKYTEPGGRIWITASAARESIMLSVRDSGAGIPREMLPRVFELFTQVDRTLGRAQGGLGIGLALVRQLARMHGGRVEARSDGPGCGSEFIVTLPIVRAWQPPAGAAQPSSPPASLQRCLVVDDNRDAADSLAMLLRYLGAEVTVAYDGASALEEMRRSSPSVVFLDLGMPAMDGFAVAAAVAADARLAATPLVAITGWGQDEDRRRTAGAGFHGHLVKPVSFDALVNVLQAIRTP